MRSRPRRICTATPTGTLSEGVAICSRSVGEDKRSGERGAPLIRRAADAAGLGQAALVPSVDQRELFRAAVCSVPQVKGKAPRCPNDQWWGVDEASWVMHSMSSGKKTKVVPEIVGIAWGLLDAKCVQSRETSLQATL